MLDFTGLGLIQSHHSSQGSNRVHRTIKSIKIGIDSTLDTCFLQFMSEEEYGYWMEASEIDSRTAQVSFEAGLYSTCVFHCQQAIDPMEKSLEIFENLGGKFKSLGEFSKSESIHFKLISGLESNLETIF